MQSYGTQRYVGSRIVAFRRDGTDKRRTEYVTADGRRMRTEYPPDSDAAGQIVVETSGERREFFSEPKCDPNLWWSRERIIAFVLLLEADG